jgi:hypothetical protein
MIRGILPSRDRRSGGERAGRRRDLHEDARKDVAAGSERVEDVMTSGERIRRTS